MTTVLTWGALADELGISRRQLTTWRRDPAAPRSRDLQAWQAFASARRAARDIAGELREAKLRKERALAERAEMELERERGGLVTRADAKAAAALVRDAFLREAAQLPADVAKRLAERLPASTRAEVERAVADAWTALRERVANGAA